MVSWLMTIKAVLISSGVASVAMFLKFSVPVVAQAPMFWSSLLTWLKPPYLYVITNGIIITIVASSKYYRSFGHHDEETETVVHDGGSPRMLVVQDLDRDSHYGFVAAKEPELEPKVVKDEVEPEVKSVIMVENSDIVESCLDDVVLLRPSVNLNWNPPLSSSMSKSENIPPSGKPLVSSRLSHRKPVKTSLEGGRALKVTKAKRNNNDTIENTWKMITEGKSTPLTKQLYRRSDTFSRGDSGGSKAKPVVYKKSETFKDRTNYYQEMEKAKGKNVRKEPSLSQDELNMKVEEFIKRFNEEMRLQRLESLRQYKEITSRGV